MSRLRALAALAAVGSLVASADEGMWTFNGFPSAKVKAKYGFEPTPEWFDHLRKSTVRLAGGCSGSFVSSQGLVMTNHHCARGCVHAVGELQKKDFTANGFFAKTEAEELRCPDVEVNQLLEVTDVTKRMQDATKDVAPDKFTDVQRATQGAIEKECGTSDDVRCEVISLYRGGRYELYKFRRLQDVRLVFAPEDAAANFGGDPDNFNYPRFGLDMAFLRAYGADGKPFHADDHLAWSTENLTDGDLTFVVGDPGGTSRALTVSQLEYDRDVRGPSNMNRLSERRGLLLDFQDRGPNQKRVALDAFFGIENGLKGIKGRHAALADKAFFGQLAANEQDFRAKVKAKPELQKLYGGTWDAIDALVAKQRVMRTEYNALEVGPVSTLFGIARGIVRFAAESEKPNGERLREYSDARLPQFRQRVLANDPIDDELEITQLTWSLSKLVEDLGPEHPVVRRVFGSKTAREVATAAVKGTKLKDLKIDKKTGQVIGGVRKDLLDGGKAKIETSKDPMLELARAYDAEARASRKAYEAEVDGPLKKQQELLAKARFAVYGDAIYPDATFTPRISFGAVRNFTKNGVALKSFTTFGGAFEHHTGGEPFALAKSFLAAKAKIPMETPFNFTTDNDIIGGNSGSPVLNRKGEVVGLAFDGNLQSLGGDYGFDEANNRMIAVHAQAIAMALETIYSANRVKAELGK